MSTETLKAQIAALEAELKDLRAQLAKAEEQGLSVYPSVEAINWPAERYEDTPATRREFNGLWFAWAWGGSKPQDDTYPPYRHVIVEGVGEVRKLGGTGWDAEKKAGGMSGPDWYHITHTRVVDVTAKQWVARVQAGDDAFESDPGDVALLLQVYSGGLRYPLATWDSHTVGAACKKLYLESHADPGVEYHKRQIPVTDV